MVHAEGVVPASATPFVVRTSHGPDACVGVAPGLPVWTDVTSATGRIGFALPPVGKPAEGQQHLELRVRSSTGDILLKQAEAVS